MKTQNVSQKHMAYNFTHLATAPSENTFIIKCFFLWVFYLLWLLTIGLQRRIIQN